MANIKCGHCGSYHESVAEVRTCSGNAPVPITHAKPQQQSFPSGNDATTKQLHFIVKLLNERKVSEDYRAQALATLVREDGSLTTGVYTRHQASSMITWLLEQPKAEPEARTTVQADPATTAKEIPFGTYTVVLSGSEDYVTLQIGPAKWADGKTVISYLDGPDNNFSYRGFAFFTNGRVQLWKKFQDGSFPRPVAAAQLLLEGDVDEAHKRFLNLAEAYALESGNCMRCCRKLTVPASLHRGLGPVCAGIEGVA